MSKLLFIAVAACDVGAAGTGPDPGPISPQIDWTSPTHIKSALGAKPWDGAIVVPGGTLDPATGNATHIIGGWLVWSSLDASNLGDAGFGMRLAVVERLAVGDGNVTWIRPDGEPIVFAADGAGGFISPVETDVTLSQPGPDRYEIRFSGATRLVFAPANGAGYLASALVDRNNNIVTFEYDGADRLVRIVDPVGASAQFEYGNGLLTRIAQPDGQIFDLAYDVSELIGFRREADGAAHRLGYDPYGLHLLTEHHSPEGETLASFDFYADGSLRGAADAAGAQIVVGYYPGQVRIADSFHRITTLTFTGNGELAAAIDPIGIVTRRATYDPLHRLKTSTDGTGATESFAYDGNNNLVRYVNGDGDVTTAIYVGRNPVSITSPTGRTTSLTYGPHDEITSIVDARGRRTDLTYDGNGNLIVVRGSDGTVVASYAWDPSGLLVSRTDANGDTEQFAYDAARNLSAHVTAAQHVWQYAMTQDGRPLTIVSPRGDQAAFAYDAANRPARIVGPDHAAESYTWDRDDRLLESRRSLGALRETAAESLSCSYDNRGGVGEGFDSATIETCSPGATYDTPDVPLASDATRTGGAR